FKSSDGGINWRQIANGLPSFPNHEAAAGCMAIDPTTSKVAYVTSFIGSPSVWRTTDLGQTWAAPGDKLGYGVPDSFPSGVWIRSLVVDPLDPQTIYAGTDRFGLYRTTNGGQSFAPYVSVSDLGDTFINCLSIHPVGSQRIYVGTNGSGVFHLPVSGLFPV